MSPGLPATDRCYEIRKSGVKILVVSGPSGGHIFPTLSFLESLKDKPKTDIHLVLPKRNINIQRENFDYKVGYISISSFRLSLDFKNLFSALKFIKGSLESIWILLRFHPDMVVSFGSLASVPMIVFARVSGIKTLIHEQNVIPGRANRFLARFADKIALSFAETKNYFKAYSHKIVLTGNPLRKELIRMDKNKALDFFGFSKNKMTILVMGGSQGSQRVNLGFLKAISLLSNRAQLQIIHLTGEKDYAALKQKYENLEVDIRLFSFLKPMHYAYSAADLVISRAGATTIAEIICFGLPAIIIPYPYAYRHQLSNAQVLERKGTAIIIEDNELDGSRLREVIDSLTHDPKRLAAMRSGYESMPKLNANDLLVEEAISLIK